MATKRPKPPPKITETTPEIAASLFAESLVAIRDEIRGLVSGAIKPGEHDKTSRIAWLAKNAAAVAAEERKALKDELDAIRKLSPTVVLTWIKQRTPEQRARFAREIMSFDAKERKSVLG